MSDTPHTGTELFRSLSPEKQEKIFDAALNEFASNGYLNASMNSLVKAAGISKGSLFLYFRTKRDLFSGVVEIATARVKQYLREVALETTEMDFFQRLERLLRAGLQFIDDNPMLARIYFHLLQSGESPFGVERVADLHNQSREFLAGFVITAIDRGEVRGGTDVDRVAFLLNAMLDRLLQAYYLEHLGSGLGLYRGEPWELECWVRAMVDLLRTGVGNDSAPDA